MKRTTARRRPKPESIAPDQLTPEILKGLTEDALRRDVLQPLFAAMGYRDVFLNHGSLEDGKDFVMWMADAARGRVNTAVVVKASPISGRSDHRDGSAANVASQVARCFGGAYQDPTKPGKLTTHECLIVCPYEPTPAALQALDSLLAANDHKRSVFYIFGERLWKLIEEHLVGRTVLDKLAALPKALGDIDPDFDVQVLVEPQGLLFSLAPKVGNDGAMRPAPRLNLTFTDNPAGQAGRDAFRLHQTTGQPVTITGEAIDVIELPAFVQKLGFGDVLAVELSAREVKRNLNLEIGSVDAPYRIANLQIAVIGGTDEITLKTENTDRAWNLAIRLSISTRLCYITLTVSSRVNTATAQLEAAELQGALSSPGVLRLEEAFSGQALLAQTYDKPIVLPPEKGWISLLRALVSIQRRTGLVLQVPDGPISYKDASEVFGLARLLETGLDNGTLTSIQISPDRVGLSRLLERFDRGDPVALALTGEERQTVLGNVVPVGMVVREIRDISLSVEERERLRAELASSQREYVSVELRTAPVDCVVYCPARLPAEARAEITKRFTLSDGSTRPAEGLDATPPTP